MAQHPQSLVDFVEEVNRNGGTYHRVDIGGGLVMDGEYAMDQYWPFYGFPDELAGLSVLDVGTASGYFAVECAPPDSVTWLAGGAFDSAPLKAETTSIPRTRDPRNPSRRGVSLSTRSFLR